MNLVNEFRLLPQKDVRQAIGIDGLPTRREYAASLFGNRCATYFRLLKFGVGVVVYVVRALHAGRATGRCERERKKMCEFAESRPIPR